MEKEKIKEALIGYFEAEPEEKFTVQELADKLKMNKAGQFNFVVQAVAQLEHDKVITLDDEGNFSLVRHESAPKFPGIFHANDRGFGFVTVDPEGSTSWCHWLCFFRFSARWLCCGSCSL